MGGGTDAPSDLITLCEKHKDKLKIVKFKSFSSKKPFYYSCTSLLCEFLSEGLHCRFETAQP